MSRKVMWQCYEFSINHPDTVFEGIGGIYMFCGLNEENQWVPLYIGKATSLAESLANNERWLEAEEYGATHIHTRTAALPEQRDLVARRLIELYQPFLNIQLMRA